MKAVQIAVGLVVVGSIAGFTLLEGRDRAVPAAAAPLDSVVSPTGVGAAEPNLAVGHNGEVYLSWLEPADSGFAFRMATLSKGKWSPTSTIRTGRNFFVNWADFPSVVVLDGKRLGAHWLQRSGSGTYAYGVRISQSKDGGLTWGEPVTPHRDSATGEHGFVAMWPSNGGLSAAWLDSRKSHGEGHGGEMMLMSTTVDPNGKLGPETPIDQRTCDCCQNAVAMTSTGPIVAYRNRTEGEIRDIYVSRLVNGKWTEGQSVHGDNWKINACPVNGPMIDASGRNVAIAWFTGARDTNKVNVAFSADGGATFGEPVRVDGGKPGGRVGLVLLADGNAVVSWLERTGGDTASVQARRVTRAGQLGAIKTIAVSSAARASGVPRMAISGSEIYFAFTVATRPSSVRVIRALTTEFR